LRRCTSASRPAPDLECGTRRWSLGARNTNRGQSRATGFCSYRPMPT
jgi:hypothetical protein